MPDGTQNGVVLTPAAARRVRDAVRRVEEATAVAPPAARQQTNRPLGPNEAFVRVTGAGPDGGGWWTGKIVSWDNANGVWIEHGDCYIRDAV